MTSPEPTAPTSDRGSIWKGIGLLALLHLIQIPLWPMVVPIVLIGLSQLLYVVPAHFVLRRKGRTETIKGLWIGAGITFLVNVACFGLVLASIGNNWH